MKWLSESCETRSDIKNPRKFPYEKIPCAIDKKVEWIEDFWMSIIEKDNIIILGNSFNIWVLKIYETINYA